MHLHVAWSGAGALALGAHAVAGAHLALVAFLLAGGFIAYANPHRLVPPPCSKTTLRDLAGLPVRRDGVIEHYLVAPVHPAGITPDVRFLMYTVVVIAITLPYQRLLGRHSVSHGVLGLYS